MPGDGRVWDPRLITPQHVHDLAADWPVYVGLSYADLSQYELEGGGGRQPGTWQLNLRCAHDGCDQSITLLARLDVQPGATLIREVIVERFTGSDLLSRVLSHMVMAHDQPLNRPEAHSG